MRIQSVVFFLLVSVPVLCSHFSFSQSVQFSDSLGPSYFGSSYFKIIGELHGSNLVLEGADKKESMQLLQFDSNCHFVEKKQLTFIPFDNLIKVDLFNNPGSWDIVWQTFNAGKYAVFFARLNERGELLRMQKLTDSVVTKPLPYNGLSFNIAVSGNHRFYMSYTERYDSAQSRMVFIACRMDTASLKITTVENVIAYDAAFEQLSKPYLDDEGNIYLARYDKPGNYRLGSTLSVLEIGLQGNVFLFPSRYSKEKKPHDLYFAKSGNKLFVGALFTDFYTHTCEGACCFSYNFSRADWDSTVYIPFTSALRKQMHKNILAISQRDLMNLLQLSYFDVKKDKVYSFLFKLECPQYPDRGTGDPNNPRNSNYKAENLTKRNESLVQNPTAPVITGPGARNFWGPTYSHYTDPSLNNSGAASVQNPEYSNAGTMFLRANPMVQKTIMLQADFEKNNANCAVIHSETAEGWNDLAPVSFACSDTLIHFSYEQATKGMLKLNLVKTGPFVQEKKGTVLANNPRLILLHENAWICLEGHSILAFYENKSDHYFGLAKLTW